MLSRAYPHPHRGGGRWLRRRTDRRDGDRAPHGADRLHSERRHYPPSRSRCRGGRCVRASGLLLAFTFSGAAARLDARRAQIVDEANAIGTAWLRLDVLPSAAQPPLRDAFRRYTDSRVALYRTFSESGREAARAEYARSAGLQNEIWAAAVAACREAPSTAVVVLPAINAMFDIASTRFAAARMHPPLVVYLVLAVISLVCGFLVGDEMGATAAPSRAHMLVLAAILSFTFYVILNSEYPRLGIIRIDDFDRLIADVRASMG